MGVKTRHSTRVNLSGSAQAMINNLIGPASVDNFTEDDYVIIDFLGRTMTPNGEFLKKTKNRTCCWCVELIIATAPSKYVDQAYLDYIRDSNFKHWTEVNCDIAELFYNHEGTANFDTVHIVASKIFQAFVDPQTHLLEAQAKIIPISVTDRFKRFGTFKTVVEIKDELDINYFFEAALPQNADLFERPLTSS